MNAATNSLDWAREAACAVPPSSVLPWTADPGDASPVEVAAMARVCAGCPVRLACAAYAHRGVTAGFWAGRERGEVEPLDLLDALAALPEVLGAGGAGGSSRSGKAA